jgi:hypothetical protein
LCRCNIMEVNPQLLIMKQYAVQLLAIKGA